MGSNNGLSNEQPVHRVTIVQGFLIGKYAVTQGQWQALMHSNPSYFTGDENLPVETVSWDSAQQYINRLNEMNDGYRYRLPTEAEWEYACRAGTTTEFAFGSSLSSDQANFFDGEAYRRSTTPVGRFAPNAFGLFDMHGNVLEWCEDWFHKSYEGAPSDGSAWLSGGELVPVGGSGLGKFRVMRGGLWHSYVTELRSAHRFKYKGPDHKCGEYVGLRLVAEMRIPKPQLRRSINLSNNFGSCSNESCP